MEILLGKEGAAVLNQVLEIHTEMREALADVAYTQLVTGADTLNPPVIVRAFDGAEGSGAWYAYTARTVAGTYHVNKAVITCIMMH